ncbi:ligase-associated DNA damage response endonuclease PdeM [Croceicoccus sp. Ery15]|uniref:ligase-associated DNA damage response endonuclease PdeM n=1 Tax=Croceicoccus sp. Ery15 TaxID=1703338 RepID=UPI00351D4E93
MVPVSFAPFEFAGQAWRMVADAGIGRALYWERENALIVADLHLEKASFYAQTGQMLPPYDSRETLERVAQAVRATGARRVFTLGDNFHDAAGPERMEPHARGMLDALTRALDWVWITGNHDEKHGEAAAPGGTQVTEMEIAGIVLRHIARADEMRPELSGHFHPRLQLSLRGRRIVRPCAVVAHGSGNRGGRMVLPACGALTGGMNADDPAIVAALQPARTIEAAVPAAGKLLRFPLWPASTKTGGKAA